MTFMLSDNLILASATLRTVQSARSHIRSGPLAQTLAWQCENHVRACGNHVRAEVLWKPVMLWAPGPIPPWLQI